MLYGYQKKSTGRFSMLTSVEAMATVNHCYADGLKHLNANVNKICFFFFCV